MRKIPRTLLLVLLLICISSAPPITATEVEFVTGRIVVGFREGLQQATIFSIATEYGLTINRVIPSIDAYVLKTPPGQENATVSKLNKLGAVRYAELVGVARGLYTPTDPDYGNPNKVYAPQKINAPRAWDVATGEGIVVAVLDSGLSLYHPEFAGRVVSGYNFVSDTIDTSDDRGHGTHVTGIIAMGVNNGIGSVGIAPNAKIMPIKVLNAEGVGEYDHVAEGIIFAVDNGAKVINMSLAGRDKSQMWEDALNYAVTHNVFVVAAVGNEGSNIAMYPAWYDQTMSVAGTTPTDGFWGLSSWGDWVDVSAPAESVWSTWWTATNPNGYTFKEGTSMAAPHVAGLAALLWSKRPELSIAEVRAFIENTATDLGTPGPDWYFGHGRINAGLAVQTSMLPLMIKRVWLPLPLPFHRGN